MKRLEREVARAERSVNSWPSHMLINAWVEGIGARVDVSTLYQCDLGATGWDDE